jgi:signal transduction histidine kinase
MQQVLMNLFINAAEAMSEVSGRPRRLLIRSDCNDAGLVIQVEDTGSGIPAGHRERIFEAFYTTKKHGTGMGLSICRSVVTAHGGTMIVTSKDPYGTVFEINLPTLDVIQPASVPSPRAIHPAPRNGEPTLRECSP